MSTRKLTYFEWNGLGEPIRYILLYTGKQFEDNRVDLRTWPDEALKATLPFGKMPVLEEDGKRLHQSMAIARYLAAGTELLPSDPWQQAVLDATIQTVYEFAFNHAIKHVWEVEFARREELVKKFYDEGLDYYMSRFEKQLKDNNGYFIAKLSWADIYFVAAIEAIDEYLKDKIEKNYPTITGLMKRIHSLPGIKEYVAQRKPYIPYHVMRFESQIKK